MRQLPPTNWIGFVGNVLIILVKFYVDNNNNDNYYIVNGINQIIIYIYILGNLFYNN